jgi:hypothetical protein
MTQGPFLYDDGPEPLHTSAPQKRQWWVVFGLLGIVLLAVVMVFSLPLIKGSAEDQSRDVADVFFQALAADDLETAHGLLCESERARLEPEDVAGEYLRAAGRAEITDVVRDEDEGEAARRVTVRWADGESSELVVIPEEGAKVCGSAG